MIISVSITIIIITIIITIIIITIIIIIISYYQLVARQRRSQGCRAVPQLRALVRLRALCAEP